MPDNSLTSLQFLRVCPASTTTKVAWPKQRPFFVRELRTCHTRKDEAVIIYGAGCGTAGVIYFYFPRSPGAPAPGLLLFEICGRNGTAPVSELAPFL